MTIKKKIFFTSRPTHYRQLTLNHRVASNSFIRIYQNKINFLPRIVYTVPLVQITPAKKVKWGGGEFNLVESDM